MGIKTIYSKLNSIDEITKDLKNQANNFNTKAVLFFSSSKFDPEELSRKMNSTFENSNVFGCTTAGEIITGKMLKESVVAMLFDSEVVEDIKIEIVENINQENKVPETFKSFEQYYNVNMNEMDFENHVGIILVDGLSCAEEKLMDKIGDLTNVTFIGASAGDDLKFEKTHVFGNGKSYTNAAVLAVIKTAGKFDFIKTQSFCPLDKELIATKVDEASRTVIEFNNKPAAEVYANALNTTVEEAANHFMSHPVGLMLGEEPYVRSPQQIQDSKMVFYCNIKEGMPLKILESTDIVTDTKKVIENYLHKTPNILGMINFHCILRTLELEQKDQTEEYGLIFKDIPTIGFSTYGEEFIGHINQTSTILVFK